VIAATASARLAYASNSPNARRPTRRPSGSRIFSAYTVPQARVWIITEADRSATTILLPDEY